MLLVDHGLAKRLEAGEARGVVEYTRALAMARGGADVVVEPMGGGWMAFAGVGSPLTQAVGLGMNGAVAADEMSRMESFFRDRDAIPMVALCPYADWSLVRHLNEHNYEIAEFVDTLVRPLDRPLPNVASANSVRVSIAQPDEADLWIRTLSQAFHDYDDVTPPEVEIAEFLYRAQGSMAFLARIDDEPAGAGAMAIHDGTAFLYAAGTRTALRRRGVHTALLRARLELAIAQGCELATVGSNPGSTTQRNAERLGFHHAYVRLMMKGKETTQGAGGKTVASGRI